MTVRWRTSHLSRGALRVAVAPAGYAPPMDGVDAATTALVSAAWREVISDRCPGFDHEVTIHSLAPHTTYVYQLLLALSTENDVGDVGHGGATLTGSGDGSAVRVHAFTTSPLSDGDGVATTRLWVVGDSGTGNEQQARVLDAFMQLSDDEGVTAAAMLALGDNAYASGTEVEYQSTFFDVYRGLLYGVPLWTAFGNHDMLTSKSVLQQGPYYNAFNMPSRGQAGGVPSHTSAYYRYGRALPCGCVQGPGTAGSIRLVDRME